MGVGLKLEMQGGTAQKTGEGKSGEEGVREKVEGGGEPCTFLSSHGTKRQNRVRKKRGGPHNRLFCQQVLVLPATV